MGRRPNFEPVKTEMGWMVSVPAGMSGTGKRVRRFFPDPKKAAKYGASLRAKHAAGVRGLIPVETAMQAVAALKILEPVGISLIEAARLAAAMRGGATVTESFRKRWLRVVPEGETRWSDRYAADMGKIPRWVGPSFMKTPCAEISDERIREALRKYGASSPSTLLMRRARVLAVLNWKEERVRRSSSAIQILSVSQCARVLRAAESSEQRRVIALLLFAGIRPDAEFGEVTKLEWSAVGKSEIYVSPQVSKVGDRHVPLTPRLQRLLRGHPEDGLVAPAGWRRAWQRIRKEAEISEMQDVLRHTFASNFLAAFGEEATKQAMGHTQGSATLFRHYRRAVTAEAGKRFFGVR